MNRKMPALTSPWKVGFLVALLLVVTALGVSYSITGTFGLTWHWISVGGLSPATWRFNPGAFVEEMLPPLSLTSLLAFAAHGLVAGAVRRYKTYVDSGAAYKQLLKSIKSVDDLEDEQLTDALKQHPELREFMMSVKNRVAAAERAKGERTSRHSGDAAGGRGPDRQTVASECAILASAAMNGRDGFAGELALSIPELKQVEQAMRRAFADRPAAQATDDSSRAALNALRASVRGAALSLRREADACVTGAREVEAALVELGRGIEALSRAPAGGDGVSAVLNQVDATADSLAALGEETRRIAIATALQASAGPDGDAIRVADEARTVATRFNAVSQQWKQVTPILRGMLEAAAASRPRDQSRDALLAAAGAVAGRARLCAERAAALLDHVRGIERAAGAEGASAQPASEAPAAARAAAPGRGGERPETPEPAISFQSVAPSGESDDGFETQGRTQVFGGAPVDDTPFADIPGFEKERNFFVEPEGRAALSEPNAGDRFEVEGRQREDWSLEPPTQEADEIAGAPAEPVAAPASPSSDGDGFLTGPRPTRAAPTIRNDDRFDAGLARRPVIPAAEPPAAVPTATLEPETVVDPDVGAVDLYALGAVDCADR